MSLSIKKVAGYAAAGAAVIGGTAYLAKTGKLSSAKKLITDKVEIASKSNPNISKMADKAAKGADVVKNAGKTVVGVAYKTAQKAVNFVKGSKTVQKAVNFVKGVTPEEINPDLAGEASKAAETFNNFAPKV